MINETFNMQLKRIGNDLTQIVSICTEGSVYTLNPERQVIEILNGEYETLLLIKYTNEGGPQISVAVKDITSLDIRKYELDNTGVYDDMDRDDSLSDLLPPTHTQILSLQ